MADWLAEAARLARCAIATGSGGPFGAVVVRNGEVVGRGWNQVLLRRDPTAHAEVLAIRHAARATANVHLDDCELFTTSEPCPMCLAAACWARIGRVWFATGRAAAAAAGFQDSTLYEELAAAAGGMSPRLASMYSAECEGLFEEWRLSGGDLY